MKDKVKDITEQVENLYRKEFQEMVFNGDFESIIIEGSINNVLTSLMNLEINLKQMEKDNE